MYVELEALEAEIPPDFLVEALDDNEDGVIDAWEKVQSASCRAVDSLLGVRFSVPFTAPLPAVVEEAAYLFACEKCYLRRGHAENPFTKRADSMRSRLNMISKGELPLDPNKERQQPSGSVITSPSRTHSDRLSI